MSATLMPPRLAHLRLWPPSSRASGRTRGALAWRTLPRAAQLYVGAVILAGACGIALSFPRTWPDPWLFVVMIGVSCVTSTWKVNLPISVASGSTLSVSHAADLMSLVLLGPRAAVLTAIASAWTQCTFSVRQPYPWYRTIFSIAAEATTMVATGFAYVSLGGAAGPLDFNTL